MYLKEKQLTSKKVFECNFMELYEDDVLLPNNKTSKRVYVKHLGAACVIPITKDNLIIMTKQYRYPIQIESIEIPAGKKDFIEENGYDCVKRELEEETGYQSNNIQHLLNIHNCVGYSNELIEVFVARDCFLVEHPRHCDEDEFIEVNLYTFTEVKDMISKGIITDAKTILAFQTIILDKEITL